MMVWIRITTGCGFVTGATIMTKHISAMLVLSLVCGMTLAYAQPQYWTYVVDPVSGDIVFGGSSRAPLRASILAKDAATGQSRVWFTAPVGEISSFAIAPTTGLLAAVTSVRPADPERRREERRTLFVVDSTGKSLGSVEQARRFSWRSTGTDIAVVTGEYRGSNEEPATTGVWIYSVATKQIRKVSDVGLYVHWAAFDGNLYIWDVPMSGNASVKRFNISTNSLDSTSHKGIDFSRSGRYYFKANGIAGPSGVFTRLGDQDVILSSRSLTAFGVTAPLSWAPDKDILMMSFQKLDKTTGRIIYDPATDSVREISADGVVGWGARAAELLVAEAESATVRTVTDLTRQ
jgi:hypothetical protein